MRGGHEERYFEKIQEYRCVPHGLRHELDEVPTYLGAGHDGRKIELKDYAVGLKDEEVRLQYEQCLALLGPLRY